MPVTSPPTNSPSSEVISAYGLKNEEYTSFGGELVGGEILWWRGDRIPCYATARYSAIAPGLLLWQSPVDCSLTKLCKYKDTVASFIDFR